MGRRKNRSYGYRILLIGAVLSSLVYNCKQGHDPLAELKRARHYLNLHDSVEYVGMNTCKECHFQIYTSYLRTGMGLSFDTASPLKSSAVIGEDSVLYDVSSKLHYKPYWQNDSLMLKEFREIDGKEVHSRTEHVSYIVGSGQHTNSHIFLSGNYAYQAPFTYYTQDGLFDLPPGFEGGHNSRFSRKIGLECMSCHNGFPRMTLGSENRYEAIPDGIDCERCHGPGEIHVMLKKKGFLVDTSRFTDYSIVNPAKLPRELQTDLCARCHLQGTMVLKPGKSFFDFKPGMALDTVMDIFMPLFEGGKEDFIMASHYERMVQSRCYLKSDNGFTCTNCHNPHVSKKETPVIKYNNTCITCHGTEHACSLPLKERQEVNNNCVSCHMREGPTRDIPHVRTHDHKISKPPTAKEHSSERHFKGLISVNDPSAGDLTIARGYLLEFESYHPDPVYLDSAWHYLQREENKDQEFYFNALVNYHFLMNGHGRTIDLVEREGITHVLDHLLTEMDYSNYDAWTAYRIGQAYESSGNALIAEYFYSKAVDLAPFLLEFRAKYGSILGITGKVDEAIIAFEFILAEDPGFVSAYVNLGYLLVSRKQIDKGEALYRKALQFDPDHKQALLNLAATLLLRENEAEAMKYIEWLLIIDPGNEQAQQLKSVEGSGT